MSVWAAKPLARVRRRRLVKPCGFELKGRDAPLRFLRQTSPTLGVEERKVHVPDRASHPVVQGDDGHGAHAALLRGPSAEPRHSLANNDTTLLSRVRAVHAPQHGGDALRFLAKRGNATDSQSVPARMNPHVLAEILMCSFRSLRY